MLPDAMAVHGLSMEELAVTGVEPAAAMKQFAEWVETVVGDGLRPVFVAHNATFDWMFVNDYFHRYMGTNPFGHSALDMKAYFMALTGVTWSQTSLRDVAKYYGRTVQLTHNALQDAQDQAVFFALMLKERAALLG